ncbi:response regulator [Fulvivirga sp. M361]|uniref:response regulator n=1 Tax=Fulvivirga sp. M361 TaxID=2594266 RepID=UPI00117B4D04|nr:response regulator [Fulvivirga sp. M361]TRX60721.1 response regulator [Fulvivirga sp. M361]
MNKDQPIMLIEDDVVDALTVERALGEIKIDNMLIHVQNGDEALSYLKENGDVRPAIILLDLNMPGMNGLEFLEQRFASPELRSIPLVVLTTSKDESDINASFAYGISGYMVKPVDYKEFVDLMKVVKQYWCLSEAPN